MPPAWNGTEARLDVLIKTLGRVEALLSRLTPAAAEPEAETVELREPVAPAKPKRARI